MAQVSLTISRWRMLRLAMKKKKQFRFEDVRSMARRDWSDLEWLISNGMVVDVGNGFYELTDKGKESADLGFYDWQPPPRRPEPAAAEPAKRRKK